MNDLVRQRLMQARESLDDARALLDAGMDRGRVLTNVYYAFYYPVVAAVFQGRVPDTMQSVTLGLFEQQFVRTGKVPAAFFEVIRKVFDSKPTCSGERTVVDRHEMDAWMRTAGEFIDEVERTFTS